MSQIEEAHSGVAVPLPPRSLCSLLTSAPSSSRAAFASRGYANLPPPLAADALAFARSYYERRLSRPDGGGFYRDERSKSDRELDSILAHDRWRHHARRDARTCDDETAPHTRATRARPRCTRRHALDNDELGVHLGTALAPIASHVAGRPLKVGFVKVARYGAGSQLPPHRDQVRCARASRPTVIRRAGPDTSRAGTESGVDLASARIGWRRRH